MKLIEFSGMLIVAVVSRKFTSVKIIKLYTSSGCKSIVCKSYYKKLNEKLKKCSCNKEIEMRFFLS